VPWRIVLLKNDNTLVVLRGFEAYPTGLHFSVVLTLRPEIDEDADPRDLSRTHMMMMHGHPGGVRIGVQFSDGRKTATGSGHPYERASQDPENPILLSQGGGGGGWNWHQDMWLWPLPPPGPLTWVASWEERHVAEQTVVVDASVLASAADEAEKLWDPPEGAMGWSGSARSTAFGRLSKEKPEKGKGKPKRK